jgi:organic hydroperoxide reductase OsmC/OhrA
VSRRSLIEEKESTMSREHHYQVGLTWTGAARGPTSSYQAYSREYVVEIEGKPTLRGSADPLFRGDASLHNPEDLVVAALSSCHMLSFLAEAARLGLKVVAYSDSAVGTMHFGGGSGQFVSVALHPRVVVPAGSDPAMIHSLHEKAHQSCFIARSVNFPVSHEVSIEFQEV